METKYYTLKLSHFANDDYYVSVRYIGHVVPVEFDFSSSNDGSVAITAPMFRVEECVSPSESWDEALIEELVNAKFNTGCVGMPNGCRYHSVTWVGDETFYVAESYDI